MNLPLARSALYALAVWWLLGCQVALGPAPAVLRSVNAPARQELDQAVAELLGTSQVQIGPEAWTTSSLLIVDRMPLKDAQGVLVQGLEHDMPSVFRLELQAGQCRVVKATTGQSRVLRLADCQARP